MLGQGCGRRRDVSGRHQGVFLRKPLPCVLLSSLKTLVPQVHILLEWLVPRVHRHRQSCPGLICRRWSRPPLPPSPASASPFVASNLALHRRVCHPPPRRSHQPHPFVVPPALDHRAGVARQNHDGSRSSSVVEEYTGTETTGPTIHWR